MKLKTRPGEQFGIKHRALMLIKQAFDENGIKFALPTVCGFPERIRKRRPPPVKGLRYAVPAQDVRTQGRRRKLQKGQGGTERSLAATASLLQRSDPTHPRSDTVIMAGR